MSLKFFLLFLCASSSFAALNFDLKTINFGQIVKAVKNVQKVVKFSQKLVNTVSSIAPESATRQGNEIFETYALCSVCQNVIDEFMYMRREEKLNSTELIDLAIEFCIMLEIESERVCKGIIELNAPSIIYIVDNRKDLTADTVCRVLLDDGECFEPFGDKSLDFTISIDEYEEHSEDDVKDEVTTLAPDEDLTIVHITDIHIDLKYKQGALAVCENYACCRDFPEKEDEVKKKLLAGKWGDYRGCDTPRDAVENALEQIKKQHKKIDAIYMTGDVVDHFIFDASVEDMKKSILEFNNLTKKVFGDIPIYPIIGNHETQNLFAPMHVEEKFSTQWLYDLVSDLWSSSLSKDSKQTLKDGGYYTTQVRPGLKLIAMNNNPCFLFNWWIFMGMEPIREQFQWLHDTLLDAEQAGEKVHILVHIPNNIDEVHGSCSREYRRIIDRFHKTIVAQFNGHTEFYGFHLYYKENNLTNPIAVGYNGGSIASYNGANPNYAVYGVNSRNYYVKDSEVWTYNLTAANLDAKGPQWFRQASLRKEFNLTDLSPTSLDKFVRQMLKDPSMFDKFWHLQVRNSDFKLRKGCNKECIRDAICEIVSSDNTHYSVCDSLFQQLKD